MDSEAFDDETLSSRGLKLLIVLFPGALILAISFQSSPTEMALIGLIIEVVGIGIKWMIGKVLFGILYILLTPLDWCSDILHNTLVLLYLVAWSCRLLYRLITLVVSKHDRGEGGKISRLNKCLQAWLFEFEAELHKGNYSNPAILAAQSVHLLPQVAHNH